MYLFHIFRSLVPLRNPLGFGASDLLALGLAVLALIAIFGHAYLANWFARAAARTGWCMLTVFLLPVALRLALLPRAPIPVPTNAEDFSSLLISSTLLDGRLANPPHPLHEFFETPLVMQEPVYRSTLPFWDGLLPAAGELLFRNSWAGILLGIGTFSALSYWMFRAWLTPAWSLGGGILVACAFGPLCRWTNGYWGGFIAIPIGCAMVGALRRLRQKRISRDIAVSKAVPLRSVLLFVVLWVASAHFLFWYGMHAFADQLALNAVLPYGGQDFLDNSGQQSHRAVQEELNRQSGQQVVFVHRGEFENSTQWIGNSADIDAEKIVWARDLGEQNNRKLLDYFHNRKAWLLEPDAIPPRLRPYPTAGLLENVQ